MVQMKDVLLSNSSLKSQSPGLVALFIGGTSGVGKGSLLQFAKHANAPTIYIVGRSKGAATPLLHELESRNPEATFNFIQAEISLIKNVDSVCDEIKAKEKKLDLLFLSTGYITFAGRRETVEGIDTTAAVAFYSRLRTVCNLIPLLKASPTARVVCVLAGGKEGAIDLNDLECHNHPSMVARAGVTSVQMTLALEELAKREPSISYCHAYPGFVKTGQLDRFMQTAPGIWAWPALLARWTIVPLVSLLARSIEDAGERGVFIATSARYPPANPKGAMIAELPKGVEVAKSSDEQDSKGNGVYLLDADCDSAGHNAVLEGYRKDEAGKLIWSNMESVWKRALEKAV